MECAICRLDNIKFEAEDIVAHLAKVHDIVLDYYDIEAALERYFDRTLSIDEEM